MRKLWRGLVLSVLSAVMIIGMPGALAQSFDCRKARAPDERAICADRYLAVKDEIIAMLYFRIRDYIENYDAAMGELSRLRREQREFLRRRRACGGERECIDREQRRRILELLERYRRAFDY